MLRVHISATAVWLLLLLAVPYGAPIVKALPFGETPTTSCCKLKTRCCCKSGQKASADPAWVASESCPRRCVAAANLPYQGPLWTCTSVPLDRPQPASKPLERDRSTSHSSAYPAFLYQRPPPSA